MKRNKIILSTLIFPLFIGCANHLAVNPISAIGGVIENANYNSKRKKVEAYAKVHYDVLKVEMKQGSGSHLDEIMNLANVKKVDYPKVKTQLKKDWTTTFHNTQMVTEPIVQSFAKLYMPKEKTKKMNGFTYTEAYNIVKNSVERDFEKIRLAVKNNQVTELKKIASKLHIDEASKNKQFIHALDGQYARLYVDLVVVSVMIHGV